MPSLFREGKLPSLSVLLPLGEELRKVHCPKSLADGCYCWHHEQILKAVAESIVSAISTKHYHAPKKDISIITAGERPRVRPQTTTGLLHMHPDWQLHVDLQHISPARLDHHLRGFKTPDHAGTYSALGREDWGSQQKETCKVSGAGGRMQQQGLEDLL